MQSSTTYQAVFMQLKKTRQPVISQFISVNPNLIQILIQFYLGKMQIRLIQIKEHKYVQKQFEKTEVLLLESLYCKLNCVCSIYCSATDIVLYMMVYAKTTSKTSLIFQCHYCSVQGKQYNLITYYLFLIDKFTTFLAKSTLQFEVKRSNFSQQPQSHQLTKIEVHITWVVSTIFEMTLPVQLQVAIQNTSLVNMKSLTKNKLGFSHFYTIKKFRNDDKLSQSTVVWSQFIIQPENDQSCIFHKADKAKHSAMKKFSSFG